VSRITYHMRKINSMKTLPKRYCISPAEWAALHDEVQAYMEMQGFDGLIGADIEARNFLLCGVPVVMLEVV
jgi:hypothetical protein